MLGVWKLVWLQTSDYLITRGAVLALGDNGPGSGRSEQNAFHNESRFGLTDWVPGADPVYLVRIRNRCREVTGG